MPKVRQKGVLSTEAILIPNVAIPSVQSKKMLRVVARSENSLCNVGGYHAVFVARVREIRHRGSLGEAL